MTKSHSDAQLDSLLHAIPYQRLLHLSLWIFFTLGLPLLAQAAAPIRGLDNPNIIPGQYIVVLKSRAEITASAANQVERIAGQQGFEVKHRFQSALNGFTIGSTIAGIQTYNSKQLARQLDALVNNPAVDFIEADQWAYLDQSQGFELFPDGVQSLLAGDFWGLDRINQQKLPLDQSYSFATTGKNVHAYILDSGINVGHQEFINRVASGMDFVKDGRDINDCYGHGTHIAGTLGGTSFGVAKDVTLHPVRVFGCEESTAYSVVISAIEWVINHRQMPALINMSLGGKQSDVLNAAVENAVVAGIVVVAAAGNEAGNACTKSPASAANAISVGSSNNEDERSPFSNSGKCVALFAPGSDIRSAWIPDPQAEEVLSGTSMAAPYVAGVVARYLEKNPTASPATVKAALLKAASKNVLSNIGTDSPNLLLNSDIDSDPATDTQWQRTLVFIYGQTQPGQDMFIRGGIDHDYAQNNLHTQCSKANMLCAIPMRHLNWRNATTAPWKRGDLYLDWYGVEANQDAQSQGSALDWTTNLWPREWGTAHKVADDGYGETPFNQWGSHYWMLDIEMDCSKTVNGWFELKSFISNGPGWEADIHQANAPYRSINHFAQCGKLNVFNRGQHNPVAIKNI